MSYNVESIYFDTINYDLEVPSPSPPTLENYVGTDDQGRDVLARDIYGFRITVFFGLIFIFECLPAFNIFTIISNYFSHFLFS